MTARKVLITNLESVLQYESAAFQIAMTEAYGFWRVEISDKQRYLEAHMKELNDTRRELILFQGAIPVEEAEG